MNLTSFPAGILRNVENNTRERENNMNSAFQDMEALMLKARDMVTLAAELNEKLTALSASKSNTQQTPTWSPYRSAEEPEEATFIRSSLSQLGLQMSNAPVTMDMMKDERKWLEELARELGRLLQGSWNSVVSRANRSGGIMKNRGIIALDEVWGGWNRVRGVGVWF
jgi:ESCRT-II complex subunit VPS36